MIMEEKMENNGKPTERNERVRTLYVSDMDGTLLDGNSRVSLKSASILSDLAAEGALVTVATARTPATVQPLLEKVTAAEVEIDGKQVSLPAIVMTGAALWDRTHARFIECRLLSEADAVKISEIFSYENLRPFTYCLSGDSFLNVYHTAAMSDRENSFYQERRHLELKRFHLDQHPAKMDHVVLMFATGPVEAIKRACDHLRRATGCAAAWYPDIFTPDTGIIDIYAPGVSKAAAVKELARKVGATRTVVFGDNLNDLPMMRVADVAVAVDNALPEVKAEADIVIGRNTEDAVARFIAEDFRNN